MDELELKYIMAIADIMCDESVAPKIMALRFEGVKVLRTHILAHQRNHIASESIGTLIEAVWDKKLAKIMGATTKKEIENILLPSTARLAYSGEMEPINPHHVEEEEYLFWLKVSPHLNLISEAQERQLELFRKFFPEMAEKEDI